MTRRKKGQFIIMYDILTIKRGEYFAVVTKYQQHDWKNTIFMTVFFGRVVILRFQRYLASASKRPTQVMDVHLLF